MLFINLDKLKIHKGYNFHTFTTEINDDQFLVGTIAHMKDAVEIALNKSFETLPSIDTVYEIILSGEGEANDDEAADFVVAINVIMSAFFNRICQNKGRARERRLDVPNTLKTLKCNLSLVKNAINSATLIDNFNVIIKYKDLTYYLADERELEELEFVHDVDELTTEA
jgi:hypothetical protein